MIEYKEPIALNPHELHESIVQMLNKKYRHKSRGVYRTPDCVTQFMTSLNPSTSSKVIDLMAGDGQITKFIKNMTTIAVENNLTSFESGKINAPNAICIH